MRTIKGSELEHGSTIKICESATNPITVETATVVDGEVYLDVLDIFGRHWWLPFPVNHLFIVA